MGRRAGVVVGVDASGKQDQKSQDEKRFQMIRICLSFFFFFFLFFRERETVAVGPCILYVMWLLETRVGVAATAHTAREQMSRGGAFSQPELG